MKAQKVGKLLAIALVVALASVPFIASAGQFRGAGAMQGLGMGANLIDTDGDGIGDTRPVPGTGTGQNAEDFIDADEDGVCDFYIDGSSQLRDGSGENVGPHIGQGYRGGR